MLLILISLLIQSSAFAVTDVECERHLLAAKGAPDKFIFGRASHINLSLLKNFESIEDEVRHRFNDEVNSVEQLTRLESHAIALQYYADPSEANRQRVFKSLMILTPIASRHLLSRVQRAEALEDYFQTGYMALWKHVPNIRRIPEDKMKSILYWDGVTNGFRKIAFAAMRTQFKKMYSLTPVGLPKTTEFTFEEEILLFGETAKAREEIAKLYGKTAEQGEREFTLQCHSIAHNEECGEAMSRDDDEGALAEVQVLNRQMSEAARRALMSMAPRAERVLRDLYFNDRTFHEIGETLSVSRERVREIQARTLQRLRHPAHSRALRAFFPEERSDRPRPAREEKPTRVDEIDRQNLIAEAGANEARESVSKQTRQLLARMEWIARTSELKELIKLFAETEDLALESSALWDGFSETERSNELLIGWEKFRTKIELQIVSFTERIDELASRGEAAAVESSLLQDRRLKSIARKSFETALRARMEIVRSSYQSARGITESMRARADEPMDEIGRLRRALQKMRDFQDRGDTSPEINDARRDISELLRAKESALKASLEPSLHEVHARLGTLEIVIGKDF